MFGKKAKLQVTGMSCGHCEQTVEKGLADLAGVAKVKANHGKDLVTISYKGERPSIDEVKAKVEDLGYEAASSWV